MFILDEPTKGIDVGAKAEFYRIINELAEKGAGVIVVSSEEPELIGICDRILVMREGELTGEVCDVPHQKDVERQLMAYMMGVKDDQTQAS